MATVKRANVELQVSEDKVKEYLVKGYSVIDDSGKVIQQCQPQTLDDYKRYVQELEAQINALKEKVKTLEEKSKKTK